MRKKIGKGLLCFALAIMLGLTLMVLTGTTWATGRWFNGSFHDLVISVVHGEKSPEQQSLVSYFNRPPSYGQRFELDFELISDFSDLAVGDGGIDGADDSQQQINADWNPKRWSIPVCAIGVLLSAFGGLLTYNGTQRFENSGGKRGRYRLFILGMTVLIVGFTCVAVMPVLLSAGLF